MRPELDMQLVKDHPVLFGDRHADMRVTAMCWGFECGDGWYDLLKEAADKLEPLCREIYEKATEEQKQWYGGPPCRASQVKEKFGTLRFYMTSSSEEMEQIISAAARKSAVTCETCGKKGKYRDRHGWFYVSCAKHKREE